MLPEPSVTVHMTVVFPNGNVEGALLVMDAILQLSEVNGVPKETPVALHPELVLVITVEGQIIMGVILSTTIIN